ncbi:DNA adenine methylase [Alloalcanivorax xenomutans]|uniref:DNA adenine methylase n=1 Tax=Alloalcanivorax xenomutans TaxID=1094342 RepID=UPI001F3129C1|nr:DNA adenine methylase [Alloalcanivorax xenomutans]MCE7521973.1 DNA adenine methylase [Alloalcanivorax xenomutans]
MPKPLVPWIGGKTKLASTILPLLPPHKCYVEPFAGAGGIFFSKAPSPVEVLNDVNGDIVNLYRVVKHHMEELYRQFKWILVSREQWALLKATPPETLTDVQRAARFLYLQKLAFGGKVDGQSFGTAATARPKFNLLTLEQDLVDAHIRLSQVVIEHGDWQRVFERYDRPETLFYCDPPYWETEGYGVGFPIDQYEALARHAREAQGRVVVSLNDHPTMREVFSGLTIHSKDYHYTVGGGGNAVPAGELIILNGHAVTEQGGLF